MNTQNTETKRKAWYSDETRIISFHPVSNYTLINIAENDFWTVIIGMVELGYRLQ